MQTPRTDHELYLLVEAALNEDNLELAEWYQSILNDRYNPDFVPEPDYSKDSQRNKVGTAVVMSAFAAACRQPAKTFMQDK